MQHAIGTNGMPVIMKPPYSDLIFFQQLLFLFYNSVVRYPVGIVGMIIKCRFVGDDEIGFTTRSFFNNFIVANIVDTIPVTTVLPLPIFIVSTVCENGLPGISFKMISITSCTVSDLSFGAG